MEMTNFKGNLIKKDDVVRAEERQRLRERSLEA
jgi:hypothetical protein